MIINPNESCPGGSTEQRHRELVELDIYDRVQERLLSWAKRRFWVVAAVAGFGGYGLVQAALSGTNKAAIMAELEAERSRRMSEEALSRLQQLEAEVGRVQSIADEAQVALQQATEKGDQLDQLVGSLQTKVDDSEARRIAVLEQLEILKKTIEDLSNRANTSLGGVIAKIDALGRIVDPAGASTEVLLANLAAGSPEDKVRAASALGSSGKGSAKVIDALTAVLYGPSREELSAKSACARAIWKLAGEEALEVFDAVLSEPKSKDSFADKAVADALVEVRTISTRVGLFIERWAPRSDYVLIAAVTACAVFPPDFDSDDAAKSMVKVLALACERDDFVAVSAALALESLAKNRSRHGRSLWKALAEIARPSLEKALSSTEERVRSSAKAALEEF